MNEETEVQRGHMTFLHSWRPNVAELALASETPLRGSLGFSSGSKWVGRGSRETNSGRRLNLSQVRKVRSNRRDEK